MPSSSLSLRRLLLALLGLALAAHAFHPRQPGGAAAPLRQRQRGGRVLMKAAGEGDVSRSEMLKRGAAAAQASTGVCACG